MRINSSLLRSTGVAALGGLLFGFDTAVIAGATHALTDAYQLSPTALGLTVASALWGTILGAHLRRNPGRSLRTPRQPARDGDPLCRLRARLRVRLGLVFAGLSFD